MLTGQGWSGVLVAASPSQPKEPGAQAAYAEKDMVSRRGLASIFVISLGHAPAPVRELQWEGFLEGFFLPQISRDEFELSRLSTNTV